MGRMLASVVIFFLGVTFAGAATAQDRPIDFSSRGASVFKAPGGQGLTLPSQAAAPAVVADFLRTQGFFDTTVDSLVATGEGRSARTGITHLRFTQQIEGLTVYGTYVKAAVNDDGELVHLIENLATPPAAGLLRTALGERAALDAALDEVHPGVIVTLTQGPRNGNSLRFSGDDFFYRDPTVTRVAIPMQSGVLQEGYLVETWTAEGNLLNHTLIGSGGRVLQVELRTNNDSYRIFPEHPDAGLQTDVLGPGAGNAESPIGWLFGSQFRMNITGNNANAYLDTDRNNAPDPGGSSVTDGIFHTLADLTAQPYTAANQEVAVQNLFYFNNIIHDKLYSHGFTESAGNFQEQNFDDNGDSVPDGVGGDSVLAEAQDGSGTNNANFATPLADGGNPRMQMYLWDGIGDHLVEISGGPTYSAMGTDFPPALDDTGIPGEVVVVNDGVGTSTDACEPIDNINDKIALIDRGDCTFVVKITNAQNAGAIGVIMVNNAGDAIVTMGGGTSRGAGVTIPSVLIGQSDGQEIKDALTGGGTVNATIKSTTTLMRDGDVDSDIIWHEYGHGLTWRMIGGMGSAISGAIGEGMSDVLSILANDNDVVGEYSTSDPYGIRSAPYTNYERTYGDMGGSSVHSDGEIYAATIWRLWELFQAEGSGIPQEDLFDYLIGGMNYTPSGPAFEDMRDGILTAVANAVDPDPAVECLIWEAFADFGIGVGATGVVKSNGDLDSVTQSFALPTECGGDPNEAPIVSITLPTTGSITVDAGDSVGFAGTASDTEQGDITASLEWTSSIDGLIGNGGSFSTTTLSAGTHTITASVTDIGLLTGSADVVVTVKALTGEVLIITKANYNSKKQKLDVEATSSAAPGAVLKLYVYMDVDDTPDLDSPYTMDFNPNKAKYSIAVPMTVAPTSVKVTSSTGGEATVDIGGGGGSGGGGGGKGGGGCKGQGAKPGCP